MPTYHYCVAIDITYRHGTFLIWAVATVFCAVSIWGIRLLPAIELLGGICHVAFFVILLNVLVVRSPSYSSTDFVFTNFENAGGWSNDGVSWCNGLLTVVYCFVGSDGCIHLSKEVQNSATTIPKVILFSIAINAALGFDFLLALLFCIGDINMDLQYGHWLSSHSTFPTSNRL
jgi:choline transport protein